MNNAQAQLGPVAQLVAPVHHSVCTGFKPADEQLLPLLEGATKVLDQCTPQNISNIMLAMVRCRDRPDGHHACTALHVWSPVVCAAQQPQMTYASPQRRMPCTDQHE